MIIQHNISAMNANRQLGITQGNLQKSTEKLSSGYRINRAGDDAAGLAISEKMRGQIRGLNQASTNADDGISLVQTAEGALQETQNILQRMRELAVQAATDTNTDDDRTQLQKEITQLTNEVDRIANTSEFNTKKLLDGTQAGSQKLEYGETTLEGTFTNGLVSVSKLGDEDSKTAAFDEVIRITALKDVTIGEDTEFGDVTAKGEEDDDTVLVAETLFGNIEIDQITIDEGQIEIGESRFASTSEIVTDTSEASEATTFSAQNLDKMKAGDVITISFKAAKATKAAEDGKPSLRLQVGANAGQEIELGINDMRANALHIVDTGTGEALDVTSQSSASMAIEAYDKALQAVSTERAKLGAVQNRLEHTIANLDTSEENLQSAESRIRDVDMADQMTSYSKDNILQQAGTSMLAQANQSNQTVLSLLQ